LIGTEVQHKKRDLEATPGFVPLTPNQKIKLKKFAIFNHKRTRSLSETDDLMAPVDSTKQKDTQNRNSFSNQKNGSLQNQDKKHLLAKDEFFDDSPTSNV